MSRWVGSLLLLSPLALAGADRLETEVCIYGGTSAGVLAAVQVAQAGHSSAISS